MEANPEACEASVEKSLSMVTSLNPHIGYEKAAQLAKEAFKTGKTIRELCLEKKILPESTLKERRPVQHDRAARLRKPVQPGKGSIRTPSGKVNRLHRVHVRPEAADLVALELGQLERPAPDERLAGIAPATSAERPFAGRSRKLSAALRSRSRRCESRRSRR